MTKINKFAPNVDVLIPQSKENSLYAQMKYYHDEMVKYRDLKEPGEEYGYCQNEMVQNATRVCAMAETIGILTGVGEDAVMEDFHKWMDQMKLPREDRDGKYRRNSF